MFMARLCPSEHSVGMVAFGDRLRERAGALALSHAEVARRAGLGDRRYFNYVSGRTEPDLATLVRIAAALQTTPDALLGIVSPQHPTRRSDLLNRLNLAVEALSDEDLELIIVQSNALAGWRQRRLKAD